MSENPREMCAMKRWKKMILLMTLTGPMITLHSCSTLVGTSVRDAAIDGAATFVEATTTELLDRWFGPNEQE
jgi:hypothetical protein